MGHTVQALALGIGRKRLVKALILVFRIRLSPDDVQLILTAVCTRSLARHDHVNIGVLL